MNDPIWTPKHPEKTAMWQFLTFINGTHKKTLTEYQELYQWSIEHSELFWSSLCQFYNVDFDKPAYDVLTKYQHMMEARWFIGAKFNFAQKLLTRRDNSPALLCINEDNHQESISFKELYHRVAQCAAGLKAQGVGVGDRVAGVLPNTAYAIIAMLATTSLGAIWSSCSPDFGCLAIADRLGQIEPKVLFICDGHQYQGKKHSAYEKIQYLHDNIDSLEQVVICPNLNESVALSELPKAIFWQNFIQEATECDFVSLPFDHPIYILFSSGTTGKPKCIVHGAGGTFLQHLKELGLHTDLSAQDNLCFYTTCGWMMWNWMVSALALGTRLTLYEGSPTYPNTNRMFEVLEEAQVSVFGTSAKYLLSMEKAKLVPKIQANFSSLRCILSTGSPLLPQSYDYVYNQIKDDIQLSSISGGTDIISCFALGNPILPIYKGELQCLGLGMAVEVYDEHGQSITNDRGELVCTKPFPSMPVGFWNDKDKMAYKNAYFARFKGIWAHGDFAQMTIHHGLIIYGRSDTVLNPGGVRIGTAEIYRQVEQIDAILDSLVIGQEWQEDVRVVLFVTLREGQRLDEALCQLIRQTIKQNASPRHVPAKIIQVPEIPRTISGKIVELAVKQIVHGQPVHNLQSLANPQALDYFKNLAELNA